MRWFVFVEYLNVALIALLNYRILMELFILPVIMAIVLNFIKLKDKF